MLVYEKKVDDVRHLFGTLGVVPTDSDQQLVYKDTDGNEILDISLSDLFVDDKQGGIIRLSDGKAIQVHIRDTSGSLVQIIPAVNEDVEVSMESKQPKLKTEEIVTESIPAVEESGEAVAEDETTTLGIAEVEETQEVPEE